MLDLGFVRANLELVEAKLRARGADPAALLGDFCALDKSRREAITLAEQCKARRNELSQQVGALKKAGQDATAVMEETRALKDELDELDKTAASLDEQLRQSLARVPNLTRDEVPVGTSEADNKIVKTWGERRKFDFQPKPHWEVGEALGILDLERAAKLSGARFAVYMGAGARLERAQQRHNPLGRPLKAHSDEGFRSSSLAEQIPRELISAAVQITVADVSALTQERGGFRSSRCLGLEQFV